LIGGRGYQRRANDRSDYRHLVRYAERLWPQLSDIEWTNWWNGQFALTPDFYPRIHAPRSNLFIGLGCSGRGVALSASFGAQLAAAVSGVPRAEMAVPVTDIPRIPFHSLWRVGVALRVAQARWRLAAR
jgi:glycine/D-amino acid oxidase-like deaminating enzyme